MNYFRPVTILLATVAVTALATGFFFGCSSRAKYTAPAVAPEVVGGWEGTGRIIVSWSKQRELPVRLVVHKDGSVSGTVGDASLVDGKFEQNRGPLGRRLNLATDYIIRGKLDGAILSTESVSRKSVSIPLNLSGDSLAGGLHTSGAPYGSKETMALSATSLALTRTVR